MKQHRLQTSTWLGNSNGLYRCHLRPTFEKTASRIAQGTSDLANSVQAKRFSTADGVMWFGFGQEDAGLARYDGESSVNFTTAGGLAHNDVTTITSEADGQLWVGTFGGGASRFDAKSFVNLTTDDGLVNNFGRTRSMPRSKMLRFKTEEE